jgi:hypothetical protein
MQISKKYVVGGFGGQSHVTRKPSLKENETHANHVCKNKNKKPGWCTVQPSFFLNFIFVSRAAVVS